MGASSMSSRACRPLKKALSSPNMIGMGQVASPREPQDPIGGRLNSAGTPEMWMYAVVRREIITQAMGKIVHVPVRLPTDVTATAIDC